MADSAVSTKGVQVLIADGAELVRRGIRDVLARERGFRVVGEVTRPDDVAAACRELSPDIVFFGFRRASDDPSDGPGALAALRQTFRSHPFARVIVLVETDAAEELLEAVRVGARGLLLRDAPGETVLEAARDVLAGDAMLDPRLARSLLEYLAFASALPAPELSELRLDPGALRLLSPREQEVLQALAQGYRNKEIAAALGVSTGTVKTHLRHIFRKLRVADRTAAVLFALQVRRP